MRRRGAGLTDKQETAGQTRYNLRRSYLAIKAAALILSPSQFTQINVFLLEHVDNKVFCTFPNFLYQNIFIIENSVRMVTTVVPRVYLSPLDWGVVSPARRCCTDGANLFSSQQHKLSSLSLSLVSYYFDSGQFV